MQTSSGRERLLIGLVAWTVVTLANPVAHLVRAVEHIPYASWHPINLGLGFALVVMALGWAGHLWRAEWRSMFRATLARGAPLLGLAAWAALTSPWSLASARSLGFALHLGLMSLATFVVVSVTRPEILRRGALVGVLFLLFASLISVVLWPSYSLNEDALYRGAWRGVFASKNHLGLVAALAIVLSAITRAPLGLRVAALALGSVTLTGARSGTGLLMAVAGVGVAGLVQLASRLEAHTRRRFFLASTAFVACGLLVLSLAWQTIAIGLGRDPSLTGRTVLWAYVLERIQERPFLGYGLRAFFESGQDETALQDAMNAATAAHRIIAPPRQVEVLSGSSWLGGSPEPEPEPMILPEPEWRVSYAHNGPLQIALDLGIVAAALLLAWLALRSAPALLRVLRGAAHREDGALLALLATLAAHNLLEVSLLWSWHPEGLVFALAVAHLVAAPPTAAAPRP